MFGPKKLARVWREKLDAARAEVKIGPVRRMDKVAFHPCFSTTFYFSPSRRRRRCMHLRRRLAALLVVAPSCPLLPGCPLLPARTCAPFWSTRTTRLSAQIPSAPSFPLWLSPSPFRSLAGHHPPPFHFLANCSSHGRAAGKQQ